MSKILNRGDNIKVIRENGDIHLYDKTIIKLSVDGGNLVLKNTDLTQLESLACSDVTDPEANSCTDLFDLIYTMITPISASGALDGLVSLKILEFDLSLAGSATKGITTDTNAPLLYFDDTVEESARIGFLVPYDFDNNVDPEIRIKVAPKVNQDTISSVTFKFQADIKYIGENEAHHKADDESKTVTVDASILYANITEAVISLTGSKIAQGDFVSFKLTRKAGADTRNGDCEVAIMGFSYKKT